MIVRNSNNYSWIQSNDQGPTIKVVSASYVSSSDTGACNRRVMCNTRNAQVPKFSPVQGHSSHRPQTSDQRRSASGRPRSFQPPTTKYAIDDAVHLGDQSRRPSDVISNYITSPRTARQSDVSGHSVDALSRREASVYVIVAIGFKAFTFKWINEISVFIKTCSLMSLYILLYHLRSVLPLSLGVCHATIITVWNQTELTRRPGETFAKLTRVERTSSKARSKIVCSTTLLVPYTMKKSVGCFSAKLTFIHSSQAISLHSFVFFSFCFKFLLHSVAVSSFIVV